MEPRPVRQCGTPKYPTRREVLAGAAAFVALQVVGCSKRTTKPSPGPAVVAPVFKHGTGRAATVGSVISFPAFLSEEEAMQVVREELAKHGVQLKSGVVLKDVHIPKRKWDGGRFVEFDGEDESESWGLLFKAATKWMKVPTRRPLELNGFDPEKKIAVEFVSELYYHELGGLPAWSPGGYDFVEAAEHVAAKVKEQSQEPIYFGVFYDPVTFDPPLGSEQEDAKKLLRAQAKDFVDWLEKQDVIECRTDNRPK